MKTARWFSQITTLFVILGAGLAVCAQMPPPPPPGAPHPPPHPALTKQQIDCLHKNLGAPSKTNRPSPQKMQAAFKACNIPINKPPGK